MVLADLGRKINGALNDLTKSNVVDETALDLLLKEISSALLESDVNVDLVTKLRNNVKSKVNLKDDTPGVNKKRLIQKTLFDELTSLVDGKQEPFRPKKGRSNVIMLVGLQGAGKTTTCTKLAVYYQRRGFKTGLVCADTFRAGAFDQLKQNATKAKIPYYGSYTEMDPVKVSKEGVDKFKKEKFDVIIVDTSGRHRQEEALFQEMIEISQAVKPNQTIMVMDASIGQAAEAQSKAFKESSNFGAIILTKMDGHAKGGGAISAVAATNTPIVFIGTGEHIHDLEPFSPQSFISQLLGIGDIGSFLDHVQGLQLDSKDTLKNIQKGIFTLRDLRDQMSNLTKMGPLNKVASLIPGMGQLANSMDEKESSERIKAMVCIIDSMTPKEIDSDGKIFKEEPSRVLRVARGSGRSVREVEDVLAQQQMMANMAKNLGGKNGLFNQMSNPEAARNNPKIAQAQRRMAQMMGGAGGAGGMPDMSALANMMKGAGGAGGMPDMSSLANMMGGAGGMPDMSAMMNNPMMKNMMKQFGMGM